MTLDLKTAASKDAEARDILRGNDMGGYTVPTHGLYPYQWNWDSVLSAWGMATFDRPRAWEEIHTLMNQQWPNGMVPHIIFHKDDPGYFPGPDVWASGRMPPTSGISQPPLAATFVRRIHEADPDLGLPHLKSLFPKLLAWHRWYMTARCDDGMVVVTHPWESGRDNALDWDAAVTAIDTSGVGDYTRRDTGHVDPAMRPQKLDYDRYLALLYFSRDTGWDDEAIARDGPFRVACPGMTFILLRAHRDLAALADVLGEPRDELDAWTETLEAGAEKLWNPEIKGFDARDMRTGKLAGSLSNASYLCWYGGVDRPEMVESLADVMERVRFPVPSLHPDSPAFDPLRYWRGPAWPIVNSLIAMGLTDMGHTGLSETLRQRTAEGIAGHGFNEYFDPISVLPAGGRDFSWTAAIWLAWASPNATGGV